MRLVPLLMKKNRCGRCLVSMLTIMALIVSSFVLPVHTLKSGAAESTSSYGLSNPTISNGVTTWDCIYFGNYYQSNSSTKEPIKWRVLSINGMMPFCWQIRIWIINHIIISLGLMSHGQRVLFVLG